MARRKPFHMLLAGLIGFAGCTGIPENVVPVTNFNLTKYLGTWYEIARLDHSFEKGLTKVTAQYSLRDDGGVRVINKGYSTSSSEWKTSEGKAYFVDTPDKAYLKVSFFGPFYGSYIVFELDTVDYQYALISGPDKSYLWLLSRTPTMVTPLRDSLLAKAAALGFDTKSLTYVEQ